MSLFRGASLIVLLSAIVVTGLYAWSPEVERTEVVDAGLLVDVITVRYSSQRVPLELEGVAQAADQIAIIAEVSGVVTERPDWFRSGGHVPEDGLLLAIDDQPYHLALAERQSHVSAASLHLADIRAKASVARRVNGNKATPYARLVPHLEEAEARLAAAEASLKRAELELDRTRIRAPFAGRLRDVSVSPGQFIRAGERLATLYSTDLVEVRLPLRDEWLSLLDIPLSGEFSPISIPATVKGRFAGRDASWDGLVVRREGGLNRNQMVYLVVQVNVSESDDVPLEPGVLVSVEMIGRQFDSITRLPASAVAGNNAVWLIDEENRLRRRIVTMVHQGEDYVWVSYGLKDGDRVAASGALRWIEGALVQPRNVTSADLATHRSAL